MKFRIGIFTIAASLLTALSGQAATIAVTLNQSAQNYVLTGQGNNGSGAGTYDNQQGTCGFASGTTTCTLSGSFTGVTNGFTTGTYSFITSYLGNNPASIMATASVVPANQFYYSFLSPSTSMVLDLTPSGSPTDVIDLVTGGNFVAGTGFSFAYTGTVTCTGIATCTQDGVGLIPGATISGPVITSVNFTTASIIPPNTTPEPRFLASLGLILFVVSAVWLRRKQAA